MALLPLRKPRGTRVEEVKQYFLRKGELPTFPAVASEFMQLAQDPYASVLQMAGVVERDPALAAKTLKLANSAYIGYSRQVASIRDSIVLLGLREMRAMVLTISVFRAFGELQRQIPPIWGEYWRHSFAVAQVSRKLAIALKLQEVEQAYLGGLLHDVGKLLYYIFDAPRYQQMLTRVQAEGLDLMRAEQREFGNSHPELGSWLLDLWNFPAPLSNAVKFHEHPELADQSMVLVGYVTFAEQLVKAQYLGGDVVPPSIDELKAGAPWQLLAEHTPGIEHFDLKAFVGSLKELESQVDQALRDMNLNM